MKIANKINYRQKPLRIYIPAILNQCIYPQTNHLAIAILYT